MRGHIRKRGDNSWAIIIDLPPGPDGKRRQKWHTVHGTKKEVEKELTHILRDIDQGVIADPNHLTVAEFLERWLSDYAEINLAPQTYRRYRDIIHVHLIPALGRHTLGKLTPMHIQKYYAEAVRKPRIGKTEPLSSTTVLQHHHVLHKALEHAVKWRILAINPATAIDPPRKERNEMQTLTTEQATKLMESARGYTLYVPIALALLCGLRRGEIFAIRWSDIDLITGRLQVRRSLDYTSGKAIFKEPKTDRGRRMVALPARMVEILRQHKNEQEILKTMKSDEYHDQGLVCCLDDGRPVLYAVNDSFNRILKRAALPHIRFHDLRHSHATALLGAGVNPKIVSERLGHSTISLTMDVYSHVLPDMQREAAAKIDRLFQSGK